MATAPACASSATASGTSVSYRELGEIVSEIARGLIDLGIAPGDRASLLCSTRPEWTSPLRHHQRRRRRRPDLPDELAGGVRVGRGQLRVALRHLRGRRPGRQDRRRSATGCRSSRRSSCIDPSGDVGDAIALDDLRERGRGRDAAEVAERAAAVTPDDPYTFIYTSGTTGPPKGCVLAAPQLPHRRRRCARAAAILHEGDVAYLYLPLAHSFALLIELIAIDLGGTIAYFGGDTKRSSPS